MTRNVINNEVLLQAVQATFKNRKTVYVSGHELFTDEFVSDPVKNTYWNGFLRRIKFNEELPFEKVVGEIVGRLKPYWETTEKRSE